MKPGDDLEIKLSKTKTYRRVTINQDVTDALGDFFRKKRPADDEWIFQSKQTGGAAESQHRLEQGEILVSRCGPGWELRKPYIEKDLGLLAKNRV